MPLACRRRFGVLFPARAAPSRLPAFARLVESLGFEELWLAEDCFRSGGLVMAATALSATDKLSVGVGLLPVGLRKAAVAAMEIATLGCIYPGRFSAAFGHGVRSWMEQVDAQPNDRLAALSETVAAVRALVGGSAVTSDGRYVRLRGAVLANPPPIPPPIMVGSTGPRGIAIAGRRADGLLLPEGCSPAFVRWAIEQLHAAALPGARARCVTYAWLAVEDDARRAQAHLRPCLEEWLRSDLFPLAKRYAGMAARAGPPDLSTLTASVCVAGTTRECAEASSRLLTAGADTLVLAAPAGNAEAQFERFAREVRPLLPG